jgi:hypothetical protein
MQTPASAPASSTAPVATTPSSPRRRLSFRTLLWFVLLLALAFGIGYVPKELERRRMAAELQTAQLDLRLANLHRHLGMASHEAQRNDYAQAGAAARQFFDDCRAVSNEYKFENEPRTRLALSGWAAQSDVVLGDLANGDPAVKEKLASLFMTVNGVLERRQ